MKKKVTILTKARDWSARTANVAPWLLVVFLGVILYLNDRQSRQTEKLIRQNASLSIAPLPSAGSRAKGSQRRRR